MNLLKSFKLARESELEEVVKFLADVLAPGMIIGLEGELGAGKTTLIKSLFKFLQVKELVVSPSYVLESIYQGVLPASNSSEPNQTITLHHWDLYRLAQGQSSEEILGSMLGEQAALSFIEWSSRLESESDLLSLKIKLEFPDEDNHELTQRRNISIYTFGEGRIVK